jgi:hypothetical protein
MHLPLNEQCAGSHCTQRIECQVNLGFAAGTHDLNLLTKLVGGLKRISNITLSDGITWVNEKRYYSRGGHQLAQEANLFSR